MKQIDFREGLLEKQNKELIKSPYHNITMEKKNISLTIGERLAMLRNMDDLKGSLEASMLARHDVDALSVKKEEWESAGLVKTPQEGGNEAWQWKDEGSEKEMELSQSTIDFVLAKLNKKDKDGEFTLSPDDLQATSLYAKIKE